MVLLVLKRMFETDELRKELDELKIRQDILADALAAAHEEIEKLQKEGSQEKQAL